MLTHDVFEQLRASASQACALLKVLANEDRFLILCQLTQGERNVGQLETALGIPQPTLSQQLGVLREEKLVETRKEGKFVYYQFASHEAATIMSTLSMLYCRDAPTVQLIRHTAMFATSSQIADQDLGTLAKSGFRTIICLRPDSREESAQHHQLKAQAELMGIRFVYFPVDKGRITPSQVAKFGELIDAHHGRVLAYCRGGTVSSKLYQLWSESNPESLPAAL